MFIKKDHHFFFAAIIALAIGFTAMAFDPVDNGFMYSLWIAPPLLLLGFILPIAGIVGLENFKLTASWQGLRLHTNKHFLGFCHDRVVISLWKFVPYVFDTFWFSAVEAET
jgi:hypothetical protein